MNKIHIFISYARKDRSFLDDFLTHLKPLKKEASINIFEDSQILPGDKWREVIESRINEAKVIIFLISANFLASDFCEQEMQQAINLDKENKILLIPIIVSDCNWRRFSPFEKHEVLPSGTLPVEEWDHPNKAWTEVTGKIYLAIEEKREKLKQQKEEILEKLKQQSKHKQLSEQQNEKELAKEYAKAFAERERVFKMLSNMMKAIHDKQMVIIRNMR